MPHCGATVAIPGGPEGPEGQSHTDLDGPGLDFEFDLEAENPP